MTAQSMGRPPEFPLVLSTLSTIFLLLSLSPSCSSFEVSGMQSSELMAGDAHYYSIDTPGIVMVAVFSDEGDVDVFSSGKTKKPDANNYEYSSASCGVDLIIVPSLAERQSASTLLYLGIHGHMRHEVSRYRFYVISPSQDDIRRYQVWEWDPESNQVKLLIDIDPLFLANDPDLNILLDSLLAGEGGVAKTARSSFLEVLEWVGYALLKTLEIALEIMT